ncbi:hypothetical protein STCU_00499 [Strigomonas culicis]|uniref:Uncharacterized protein n=1 Tax=Strigomonas culicis TaxID=28005 RepID=S9V0L3_9TRYP|nr:hypothetical protein STCU_00499 [Strigomonas culicis]|eukprot:EPY36602.1 hypothetical protein STCU_00499 [Strigomonas culicis]
MLWVALGEATREDRYLWKAWELCEHRMAAPMRALARLALDREQYEKVVQYFDLAVAVNPVFGGDWFSLGYAALRLQQWQRSGEAFTRACQIDPADAFAWNNLASIFIRENKLRPAFNSMSQALRNNRRDWRMWQNYFQIGCQLKEVLECTHALSTCLDIAKRQMVLDPTAMEQFVDLTLAYLKGSIPGSAMEATTADEGQRSVTFTSMTATAMAADESAIEHLPLEEGDDETVADLAPFGADVEMPERFFDKSEEQNKAQERAEVTKASIRQRHEERVRALFQRLMDTYVSDPDLYHSTAVLFGALDGPLAAFRYRLKELRACQQKDQWARDAQRFARTVACLTRMHGDASAALADVRRELDAVGVPDPSDERQAAVLEALNQLQNNVKAVLEAAEEHMEDSETYANLRELAKQTRKDVQEGKATFILS